MEIRKFENSGISFTDDNVFASRKQIEQLYDVPRKTLSDNINKLKEDGLIIGRNLALSSKNANRDYITEVFDLDEIISIGFRLRSDVAIRFQRWARDIIKFKLLDANYRLKMQQAQLDYFWDKEDKNDLYGNMTDFKINI